jgi:hypothetical protein
MADADSGVVYTNDGQVLGLPAGTTGVVSQPDTSLPPPAFNGSLVQARERLNQIYGDKNLKEQLLTGAPGLTKEWHQLNQIVVAANESPQQEQSFPIETTAGPDSLTRRERAVAIDGLRQNTALPYESEQYLNDLDSGARTDRPTEGDAVLMRQVRDQYFRDPSNRQAFLAGDLKATRLMGAFNRVIALAAPDGQPASEEAHNILHRLGLR